MEAIARYAVALEVLALALAVFTRRLELLPAAVFPAALLAAFHLAYGREWRVSVSADVEQRTLRVEEPLTLRIEASSNVPGLLLYSALDDRRLVAVEPPTGALYLSGRSSASATALAGLPGRYEPPDLEWAFYPLTLSRPVRGRTPVGEVEVRPYLAKAGLRAAARSLGAPRAPGPLAGPHSAEFLEVREYRPGDPYKLINWKAYARTGALYVNEKLREGHSTLYIVLDAGSHCRADSVGHGASMALSVAHAAVDARLPVGLLVVPDGVSLPPTDSPAGLKLIREALMRLDLKPPRRSPAPPRADTYIYISCRPRPEYIEELCLRARRVVVIEVSPARGPFAEIARLLAERRGRVLCADKLVWSPPLEPPSCALARL
ncbi:MAG: DUF58 domain-containing protein [Thermoproteus sp.]